MDHHDAWVVKNMYNQGAGVGDIAYALDCAERTVRRCIDRDFKPTEKKVQIGDRMEKFVPLDSGNYRSVIHHDDVNDTVSESQELGIHLSEPENYVETVQSIEEKISSMTVERFIHLISS